MGGVAKIVFSWSGLVRMDYGQFQLAVRVGSEEYDEYFETVDDMAVLEAALDGTGIAQYGPMTTVLSPHQNNFDMALTVEAWDQPVPDDLDEWEESFEVWLDIDDTGLVYGSPTMASATIPVPPGRYRTLITGRGFIASGWPGTTEPGDRWRIRLTPADRLGPPNHLSAGAHSHYPVGPATSVAAPAKTDGQPSTTAQLVATELRDATQNDAETAHERKQPAALDTWWGQIKPSETLRKVGPVALALAITNHELAEWLAAQTSRTQRDIALWAARTACRNAGPGPLNWDAALHALTTTTALPPPFDDRASAWAMLYPPATASATTTSQGIVATPAPSTIDPPAAALATISAANEEDPSTAAFDALDQAASAYDNPADLYDELRRAFRS